MGVKYILDIILYTCGSSFIILQIINQEFDDKYYNQDMWHVLVTE